MNINQLFVFLFLMYFCFCNSNGYSQQKSNTNNTNQQDSKYLDFDRSKAPLTKNEIRWLNKNKINIQDYRWINEEVNLLVIKSLHRKRLSKIMIYSSIPFIVAGGFLINEGVNNFNSLKKSNGDPKIDAQNEQYLSDGTIYGFLGGLSSFVGGASLIGGIIIRFGAEKSISQLRKKFYTRK